MTRYFLFRAGVAVSTKVDEGFICVYKFILTPLHCVPPHAFVVFVSEGPDFLISSSEINILHAGTGEGEVID